MVLEIGKLSEFEIGRNLDKARLYFSSHPDMDRKQIGLLVLANFQNWSGAIESANGFIEQIEADSFPGVSASTFKIVETEIRALLPEGLRAEPIAFLHALKTIFMEQGMLASEQGTGPKL